ncbi:MAG: Mu transposase C-terminal domain-containing protein [Rhodobacteraceae bacterium]|nr:Mu transposase C-terminal domain-containing protein [Paracoccaceae bacterium]
MTRSAFPKWWSPKDFAAAKLTKFPTTARKVNACAVREGWRDALTLDGRSMCRNSQGRGKGYEYRIGVLSEAQQDELYMKWSRVNAVAAKPSTAVVRATDVKRIEAFAKASPKKKAVARERFDALMLVEKYRASMSVREAVEAVAALIGKGPSTIYGWMNLVKPVIRDTQYWEAFLAPQHKGKGGVNAECDPMAWAAYKALYLDLEKRSYTNSYRYADKATKENGWQLASPAAMQARLKREIPWVMVVLCREGRDALWRMFPHQRRDRTMFHALQGVQADGHKMDFWVRFPDGEVTRPLITMVSDIYSNKFLGWHISKTVSSTATRLAFARVFKDWGIPEWALMDNGMEYASKEITGGQKTRFRFKIKEDELDGILTVMGIKAHWAQPGRGQSKPIERSFQDICNYIAKDPRFSGAYTGNSPVNKPAYNYDPRERAVNYDDFRAIFAEDVADINARAGRNTDVCEGKLSFDQAFEASYKAATIRKPTAEQLRMALMKAERVTARKPTGEVHLRKNRFWAEFLTEHIGEPLTLRFDPDNIHDGVSVYDFENRYLGDAECIMKVGFLSEDDAREHGRKRTKFVRNTAENAKIERDFGISKVAAMLPDVEPVEEPEIAPAAVRLFQPKTLGSTALALDDDLEEEDDFENSALGKIGPVVAMHANQRRK